MNDNINNKEQQKKKDKEETSFLSYFEESKLPKPEHWPNNSSILVTSSIRAPYIQYNNNINNSKQEDNDDITLKNIKENNNTNNDKPSCSSVILPCNSEVIHFDGPLFCGKIVSRIRHNKLILPNENSMNESSSSSSHSSSKQVNCEEYFKGRSRQFQWSVQGQFKQRTRFDEVTTGQDFNRPFRNKPGPNNLGIVQRTLNLLKHKLPDAFECELFSDDPKFEHALINGCQYFRVDKVHDTTNNDILYGENEKGDIMEDTSLLNYSSCSNSSFMPKDNVARKKFFSKRENLEAFYYETEYIYTFDFYANLFSPIHYSLHISSFFSVDLIPYFNGCPLFMAMAKDKRTGTYLWCTELWHERLLEYNQKKPKHKGFFLSKLFSTSSTTSTTLATTNSSPYE